MAVYTYDDFTKALNELGYQLSDADLALAQSNPDAGMSLLQYKQDYDNAATAEAKALAHAGAEEIRSSYGNYSGGTDGSEYYLEALNPSSFSYEDAPEYTSQYSDASAQLLEQLLSQDDFSYDPASDELYAQYKKQYAREGQRSAADALGTAAAASGGIPSSYAATAAAQAGNYYASQLTDKIPELYQLAYSRYQDEYDKLLSDLSAVQSAEQLDYEKYLDQMEQYNTDREFSYSQLLDELDDQTAQRSESLSRALTAAGYGDYSQLEALGIDTSAYQSNESYQKAVQAALTAAEYGDYSQLEALGIDTSAYQSNEDYQKAVQAAQIAAEYGDYSLLEQVIGMDAGSYTADQAYEKQLTAALYAAEYGDYTLLESLLGIDASGNSEDWKRQYQLAVLAAEYGDDSGLEALGIDTSAYRAAEQSGGSTSGIVSTMKSLGDDAKAYEYLVSLGYSSSITAQLWSLYQAAG